MKLNIKTVIIALLASFNLSAFAGTSSGGGLESTEKTVHCTYASDNGDYLIDLQIESEVTMGNYTGAVQEGSLTGLYEPVILESVLRKESENQIQFTAPGFELSIDLTTGSSTLPPLFEGRLTAEKVAEGHDVILKCELQY